MTEREEKTAFEEFSDACHALGKAMWAEIEPALTRVLDWLSARLR